MMKNASDKEKPAIALFLNSFYSDYYEKRLAGLHAPEAQVLSTPEIRAALDQLMRQSDAGKRIEVYETLRKGRLPDEVLPDVIRCVEWALTNKIESGERLLSLFNCFVNEASAGALLSYALSGEGSVGIRAEVLRLAGERQLSPEQLDQIQQRFRSETDGDARARELELLWKASDARYKGLIRESVADPNDGVREVSVRALDPSADGDRRALLGLLGADPSDRVREAAIAKLAGSLEDNPEALRAVLSVAARDSSESVRDYAVRRLAQPGLTNNADVLAALRAISASDPSDRVRAEAVATLRLLAK